NKPSSGKNVLFREFRMPPVPLSTVSSTNEDRVELAGPLHKMFMRVIMAVNREELIECLNDLIETCRDGENGFLSAAEHVKDPELSRFFNQCSLQRAQFVSELQSEVRQLGGTPKESGSVSAAFHRGWINI